MLAHVDSLAVLGVDAYLVRVEVDVSPGLISFSVVGLPDAAVRESGERVRAAIRNSGFAMPARRITVNLAPADTKKQGPIFDLPIALGVLLGDGQLAPRDVTFAACGELGLNGEVRPIAGVLPMALGAREAGKTAILVPRANAREAAVVEGLEVYAVESLADAVDWLQNGGRAPEVSHFESDQLDTTPTDLDWADVKGQEAVKRALEVAAAGGHNILMVGAPGSGKTLLSRRLPTILPPLLLDEALEVTKLYSVAGLLPSGQSLMSARPFRSPHHTVSHAGLVGGGSFPRPGEISLSHHGVLFLDELPEFHRDVLEVMRQPLEDGQVSIARAAQTLTFPARFQLVAAMNPCPCGFLLGGKKPSFIPTPDSPRTAFVNAGANGQNGGAQDPGANVSGGVSGAGDQNVVVQGDVAVAGENSEKGAGSETGSKKGAGGVVAGGVVAGAGGPTEAPEEGAGACVCTCTAPEIRRYLSKISGPLLDRIDICIEVHPLLLQARELALPGESSKTVRARVVATRARQARRGPKLNSRLRGRALREACKISESTQKSIDEAKAQFSFSQSRTDSLLRVARTIADMVGSDAVEKWHFEEAVNYRPFDRKIFA